MFLNVLNVIPNIMLQIINRNVQEDLNQKINRIVLYKTFQMIVSVMMVSLTLMKIKELFIVFKNQIIVLMLLMIMELLIVLYVINLLLIEYQREMVINVLLVVFLIVLITK